MSVNVSGSRLSEFYYDGETAGGLLLCLYSIQVEPGCFSYFWRAEEYLCLCMWKKRKGCWSRFLIGPSVRACCRVCVSVIPTMADK